MNFQFSVIVLKEERRGYSCCKNKDNSDLIKNLAKPRKTKVLENKYEEQYIFSHFNTKGKMQYSEAQCRNGTFLQVRPNCSPVLNSTEQNILLKRFNQGREIDRTISLYEALIWIAKLGGYIGRKSDSLPGIISIWRGWTRFREMVEDYEILSGKSYG